MTEQVPVWLLVLTLFVSPVLALIGVVLAQAWQDKREHTKWLREQRLLVYGECLSLASDYQELLLAKTADRQRELDKLAPSLRRMRDRLDLVGSDASQLAWFAVIEGIGAVNLAEQRLKRREPDEDKQQPDLLKALQKFAQARASIGNVVRKELQGKGRNF